MNDFGHRIATRAVYICLSLYAAVTLVANGTFYDLVIGITAGVEWADRMAAWTEPLHPMAVVAGTLVFLALAWWVGRSFSTLEALPRGSAPISGGLAAVLVAVPVLNLVTAPLVMLLGVRASEKAAGEQSEHLRFSGTGIWGVGVGLFGLSVGLHAYIVFVLPEIDATARMGLYFVRLLDFVVAGVVAMLVHRVEQLQDAAGGATVTADLFE